MKAITRHWLAWLTVFLLALAPLAQSANAQSVAPAAAQAQQPSTNEEIRQWYNDQVAVIPDKNKEWIAAGYTAEHRAELAQHIRHDARIQARAFMTNKAEVAELRRRDQAKYGNPDGPTFAYLVAQNQKRGLTGDAVYEEIVGSSNRTSEEYNTRFGVRPQARAP